MNLDDNTYEHIYRVGNSIRRYPENDVVAFAAGLRQPAVSIDMGTGTGRNLIPLLAAAAPDGLVLATDLALSGLLVLEEWVKEIGGERIPASALPAPHRDARPEVDAQYHRFYRIRRHRRARSLGPASFAARCEEHSEHVYLKIEKRDMVQRVADTGSVDAIINRGNIFFLPSPEISRTLCASRDSLKTGGRLLLSLKSTADSRFAESSPADASSWRRRQIAGPQAGLEMEFHNEARALALVKEFKVRSYHHRIWEDCSSGMRLADWIFVLEA